MATTLHLFTIAMGSCILFTISMGSCRRKSESATGGASNICWDLSIGNFKVRMLSTCMYMYLLYNSW